MKIIGAEISPYVDLTTADDHDELVGSEKGGHLEKENGKKVAKGHGEVMWVQKPYESRARCREVHKQSGFPEEPEKLNTTRDLEAIVIDLLSITSDKNFSLS